MLDLDKIIFNYTDLGGPRASGYDIIAKYMRQFFADDPPPAYDPPDFSCTPQGTRS